MRWGSRLAKNAWRTREKSVEERATLLQSQSCKRGQGVTRNETGCAIFTGGLSQLIRRPSDQLRSSREKGAGPDETSFTTNIDYAIPLEPHPPEVICLFSLEVLESIQSIDEGQELYLG